MWCCDGDKLRSVSGHLGHAAHATDFYISLIICRRGDKVQISTLTVHFTLYTLILISMHVLHTVFYV